MYANRTPEGAYITKYLKIKDTNGRIVFTEQQAYDVIRQISNGTLEYRQRSNDATYI